MSNIFNYCQMKNIVLELPQSSTVLPVFVVIAVAVVVAFTASGFENAQAMPGSNVDSVTFLKQESPDAAVDNLIAGDIDMYYDAVSADNAKKVRDAGHQLYETVDVTTYNIYLNPVDDHTKGFNPFALRDVRFALNYMFDRESIVNDIIGSGAPMYSALSPHDRDYLTVYRELGNFGLYYDSDRAKILIDGALEGAGAVMSSDGIWHYDGLPIEITIFIRHDDPVRHEIGKRLADDLEAMGFVVERKYGDLAGAYSTVYSTDPAEQIWHVYVEAWGGIGGTGYNNALLGFYYAPRVFGNLPGEGEEHFWNYQNDTLDRFAAALYLERYQSLEQRAGWVLGAATLGVLESVRIFLASGNEQFAVHENVEGVVHGKGVGIATRYTPINAQLVNGEQNLDIGVRHIVQSSWNPVGGFVDTYGYQAWRLLRDTDFERDPHTRDIYESRNMVVYVDTAGPSGKLPIPSSAIIWDPSLHAWTVPKTLEATSKVTVDLKFANWHHGQPMDLNDILFPLVFNREHNVEHRHQETVVFSDLYAALPFVSDLQGVNIIDEDTVEIYVNYWHFDKDVLALVAGMWTAMPWDVLYVMDRMVHSGDADWLAFEAADHSGNWLDMLDPDDADLARTYLEMFRDPEYEHHIPYFLYENKTSDYVTTRYNASISWMTDKNHMVISNGPFYLSDSITRADDGSVTKMVLNQFDDPTYPLTAEMWSAFTDYAPLSGDVQIGSLAPVTGNAVRYGEEIDAITQLAIDDFNDYLKMRSEKWTLSTLDLDTQTNPDVALEHLMTLNNQNIKLATGPAIDIITPDILEYATDNDMALVSCCSSVPSASIPDDALFRLLPDQRMHAKHIVDLMLDRQERSVSHLVPVAINSGWAKELVHASKAEFESRGGQSSDIVLYNGDTMREAVSVLASRVMQAVGQSGAANVAVLYIGYGEGPEFLKEAASFDILSDVRWFGADQNTASPNIADDPAAAAFADSVDFTVVQPTVHSRNTMVYGVIGDYLEERGIEQSPYSSYQYDAVWVLGLSILDAQSRESLAVKNQIPVSAMYYVGAIGSADLDNNGDRRSATYWEWEFEDGAWTPYVVPSPADQQDIVTTDPNSHDMSGGNVVPSPANQQRICR